MAKLYTVAFMNAYMYKKWIQYLQVWNFNFIRLIFYEVKYLKSIYGIIFGSISMENDLVNFGGQSHVAEEEAPYKHARTKDLVGRYQ